MRFVRVFSEEGEVSSGMQRRFGRIDAACITEEVPDWRDRTFYISGSEPMVRAVGKTLFTMGVVRRRVRRDYFPGYE
jgi:ferredoxin-NADP reductase